MIYTSYKTELNPNNKQQTLFMKNIGCARWAYNWALNKKKNAFDKKEKIPNAISLHKELNILKQSDIPWMYESSKCSPQNALRYCDKAFDSFFRKCKNKSIIQKGFPKFKSRKNEKQSFTLNGCISIGDNWIKLPRIGKVRLHESNYIPKDNRILSATITKRADKWFVSVLIEMDEQDYIKPKNDIIGIDLGIKNLATCSNGDIYENPKALQKNLKKLKRKSRQLSRKKKDSKNREKAKSKLAKLHYRISNIRKDCLHKITSKIVNENQVIVLEDLKVSNMIKNRKLSRSISDVGLYEFRRQIEYKAKWKVRNVYFADTFFPSSKLCSCCGYKKEDLKLSDRTYKCNQCGFIIDRDLNASKNLVKLYTDGLSGIYASGDGSSEKEISFSPSMKEESSRNN
jgi:putative transposase